MKIFNTNIDFKTFFRLAPKKIDDDFGVSFITGYQGSGKTYFAVYIVARYLNDNREIYTNIKSLNIPNRKITYFEKLDEIMFNFEENKIFIIDEISNRFTKEARQDKDFYRWLQQSRKTKRYVILITQEYLQIPNWLRGVARYVYTTTKLPILPFHKTQKGYAILNPTTYEWEVEPIATYIYKRNMKYCKMYETLEPIPVL